MGIDAVRVWIAGYRSAWESNDPGEIGGLFAEDAAYYPEPYAEPWVGREAIVRQWLGRRDEPGSSVFEWQPVTVTDELAVVQARTEYFAPAPRVFSNLWVIRLDVTGQARQFTEWWMEHPRER